MRITIEMAIWRTTERLNMLVKDKERQIRLNLKTKCIILFQIEKINWYPNVESAK